MTVTLIERTTATDASAQLELGTVRPGAFVPKGEIHQAAIALANLDGGTLAFGGC